MTRGGARAGAGRKRNPESLRTSVYLPLAAQEMVTRLQDVVRQENEQQGIKEFVSKAHIFRLAIVNWYLQEFNDDNCPAIIPSSALRSLGFFPKKNLPV